MPKGFHEPVEKPRRFYKEVAVREADGGFEVLLDGRSVRTPGGARLAAPTRALAEMIAGEWAAQGEVIEAAGMHATRLANTALEAIPASREAVADQIAQHAGADLLCYFAEEPQALVERQAARWGPLLERAEAEEGLALVRAAGIVHREQPPASLTRAREIALSLDDFGLAGFSFATALFGSVVLALALLRGWITADEAFDLSRLDEAFQEEKWGVDAEAAERAERLRGEARMLQRWFDGLGAR